MKNATAKFLCLAVLMLGLSTALKAAPVQVSPVSPVSFSEALQDALMIADMHGDSKVMCITGTSMLPFFGEGAIVLVKPVDAAKLRTGMVVIYRNNFGEVVAHRLVSQNENGWTAKGFNNEACDSTVVNASNLVGVVYATFRTAGLPAGDLLAQLGGNQISLAMAAPAK